MSFPHYAVPSTPTSSQRRSSSKGSTIASRYLEAVSCNTGIANLDKKLLNTSSSSAGTASTVLLDSSTSSWTNTSASSHRRKSPRMSLKQKQKQIQDYNNKIQLGMEEDSSSIESNGSSYNAMSETAAPTEVMHNLSHQHHNYDSSYANMMSNTSDDAAGAPTEIMTNGRHAYNSYLSKQKPSPKRETYFPGMKQYGPYSSNNPTNCLADDLLSSSSSEQGEETNNMHSLLDLQSSSTTTTNDEESMTRSSWKQDQPSVSRNSCQQTQAPLEKQSETAFRIPRNSSDSSSCFTAEKTPQQGESLQQVFSLDRLSFDSRASSPIRKFSQHEEQRQVDQQIQQAEQQQRPFNSSRALSPLSEVPFDSKSFNSIEAFPPSIASASSPPTEKETPTRSKALQSISLLKDLKNALSLSPSSSKERGKFSSSGLEVQLPLVMGSNLSLSRNNSFEVHPSSVYTATKHERPSSPLNTTKEEQFPTISPPLNNTDLEEIPIDHKSSSSSPSSSQPPLVRNRHSYHSGQKRAPRRSSSVKATAQVFQQNNPPKCVWKPPPKKTTKVWKRPTPSRHSDQQQQPKVIVVPELLLPNEELSQEAWQQPQEGKEEDDTSIVKTLRNHWEQRLSGVVVKEEVTINDDDTWMDNAEDDDDDDTASVRSLREIWEHKSIRDSTAFQQNQALDKEEDNASVKSLRTNLQRRILLSQTENLQKDDEENDDGSVKKMRRQFETYQRPKGLQVGKLRSIFENNNPSQSSLDRRIKTAVRSKGWSAPSPRLQIQTNPNHSVNQKEGEKQQPPTKFVVPQQDKSSLPIATELDKSLEQPPTNTVNSSLDPEEPFYERKEEHYPLETKATITANTTNGIKSAWQRRQDAYKTRILNQSPDSRKVSSSITKTTELDKESPVTKSRYQSFKQVQQQQQQTPSTSIHERLDRWASRLEAKKDKPLRHATDLSLGSSISSNEEKYFSSQERNGRKSQSFKSSKATQFFPRTNQKIATRITRSSKGSSTRNHKAPKPKNSVSPQRVETALSTDYSDAVTLDISIADVSNITEPRSQDELEEMDHRRHNHSEATSFGHPQLTRKRVFLNSTEAHVPSVVANEAAASFNSTEAQSPSLASASPSRPFYSKQAHLSSATPVVSKFFNSTEVYPPPVASAAPSRSFHSMKARSQSVAMATAASFNSTEAHSSSIGSVNDKEGANSTERRKEPTIHVTNKGDKMDPFEWANFDNDNWDNNINQMKASDPTSSNSSNFDHSVNHGASLTRLIQRDFHQLSTPDSNKLLSDRSANIDVSPSQDSRRFIRQFTVPLTNSVTTPNSGTSAQQKTWDIKKNDKDQSPIRREKKKVSFALLTETSPLQKEGDFGDDQLTDISTLPPVPSPLDSDYDLIMEMRHKLLVSRQQTHKKRVAARESALPTLDPLSSPSTKTTSSLSKIYLQYRKTSSSSSPGHSTKAGSRSLFAKTLRKAESQQVGTPSSSPGRNTTAQSRSLFAKTGSNNRSVDVGSGQSKSALSTKAKGKGSPLRTKIPLYHPRAGRSTQRQYQRQQGDKAKSKSIYSRLSTTLGFGGVTNNQALVDRLKSYQSSQEPRKDVVVSRDKEPQNNQSYHSKDINMRASGGEESNEEELSSLASF